jgi:hypothetical protein
MSAPAHSGAKSAPARAAAKPDEGDRKKLPVATDTMVRADSAVIRSVTTANAGAKQHKEEHPMRVLKEVRKPTAFDFDTVIHVTQTKSVSVSKPVHKNDSAVLNEKKTDHRSKKPQKQHSDSLPQH